jgi:hypothetical protein
MARTDESEILWRGAWKLELENLLMPMIEKYEVVLVEDNEGLIDWK